MRASTKQTLKQWAIAAALATAVTPVGNFAALGGDHSRSRYEASDPRPGKWCMWWLRRHLGIPKSAFPKYGWNIAANGRFIGSAAPGPAVGVVVVWRHHVGIITARAAKGWVVKSGNDGGAVRERPRDISRAIAFRYPHNRMAEQ